MNADGIVTEIPTSLKRLVRLVMRGFYNIEHVIVMDMLIRNPCMKEDDLAELLKFEKKQLRAVTAQLKNDRFIKTRLRMETGADGKATRQNYYYINYRHFVNVVKYKLDHMRRKIETEERDSTSRASFKCTSCEKTFTDLEAGQLCDFVTGEFRCNFCNAPVDEDESALPKANSRLMLAKFNQQIEPLYNLLREVDDIKLAPELLEPEPTDLSGVKNDASKNRPQAGGNPADHSTWSGDATRNKNYIIGSDQGITVNFGDENANDKLNAFQKQREQPIWMTQSTVKNDTEVLDFNKKQHNPSLSQPTDLHSSSNQISNDIMEALLTHERKTVDDSMPVIPGQSNSNEESSSESEDSMKLQQTFIEHNVEELESDEEETIMIQVGPDKIPLNEIGEEHVSRMTAAEKETYIRITQDLYASVYD